MARTEQVEQRKKEAAQNEGLGHVEAAGSECIIAALGDIVVSLPLPTNGGVAASRKEGKAAGHAYQTADEARIWALALTPFN